MVVEQSDGSSGAALERVRRTILVIDMVESVRLMLKHEDEVIDHWRRFVHEARAEILPRHSGRLVKSLGDGLLIEFERTPRAVAAAFDLHRHARQAESGGAPGSRIELRAGLHVCEIVEDDLDIYGTGVNLTARLAGVAAPGGVAASPDVIDELLPGIDARIEDGGLCHLKHVPEPVQVYRLYPPRAELREPAPLPSSAAPDGDLATRIALVAIDSAQPGPEQATLAELLGDLLLTRLATTPLLQVVSRLSSSQFRLRNLAATEIAQHTGASYLVAGRLHGRGRDCRLFVELVAADGIEIVWAGSFGFDEAALLANDEPVTPEIAQELLDRVASHQLRHVAVSALPNIASQSLHFSAIHLMHRRSPADFVRSREMLDHLVDRHPRVAAPHAWLAKWHVLRVTKGWSPDLRSDGDHAIAHTRRALDLNPDAAMAVAMEAFACCHMRQDLDGALKHLDEAVSIDPSEPWSWLVRSTVESFLGHGELAWQSALRARTLSPMDPLKHYYDSLAAGAAVASERYVEAERLSELSLSKDPSHLPTLRSLAIAQVHLGRVEKARLTVGRVHKLQPDFNLTHYVSGAPAGGREMRKRWAEALREAGAHD